MKKIYNPPVINVEQFSANSFISSCNPKYTADCNVPIQGILFQDINTNGRLDPPDRVVNRMGRNGFNIYKACHAHHGLTEFEYRNLSPGFLVNTNTFNRAKQWGRNPSEETKRTKFNFGILQQGATAVKIWDKYYNDNQRGWHAALLNSGIVQNNS